MAVFSALFVLGSNLAIVATTRSEITRDPELVRRSDYALVLGTAPLLRNGKANPHFRVRMNAASRLYHSGKIRRLLVSGANPSDYYNEPKAMRRALVQLGVRSEDIISDYAGRRTLDSIVRAQRIFGLDSFTVVSDPFHLNRAVFIARHKGLDVVGFASEPVPLRHGARSEVREWLARVLAVLDVFVLNTEPELLGPRIELPPLPGEEASRRASRAEGRPLTSA